MTEDSLCLTLGSFYSIRRGLDCGPNITMNQYWKICDGEERQDQYSGCYEADFLYISNSNYLYEVEVKISIVDFRADQKKDNYHDHPDVRGFLYCVPAELYFAHASEIERTCKDKGAGLIIVSEHEFSTLLRPKIRKGAKPLTDNGYIHYLRLFAKKWVRVRRENNDD